MKTLLTWLRRLFVLSVIAGAVYGASIMPMARVALPGRDGPPLSEAKSWGYQLQNARPDRIAAGLDLLVIDAQRQSSPPQVLSGDEVTRFRTRPDGRPRVVLAYLSIGEAESYRAYWWSHWRVFGPRWLGPENKRWKGNYHVRYWDPGWRRIMINSSPSMLDRAVDLLWSANKPYIDQILDAGFDGVYLDRVDAYYEWQDKHPGAEAAMIAFVAEISDYAKRRKPGFLVVPQNAEELLATPSYRRKIDGIAKEDLLFGRNHSASEQTADDVGESVRFLTMARADRLPVFVIEYLPQGPKRAIAAARTQSLGYVLHFADRALKLPPEHLIDTDAARPALPAPAKPKG